MARARTLAPHMIGRQAEVRELEEHLRLACAGTGRTVLVSGEAGVGKTCLVRTFLERLRAEQAFGIVEGYCYEEDVSVPFAPLVGVLRRFARQHGPAALAAAAGPLAPDLLRLLPELDPTERQGRVGDDLQDRKHRLFEAVYRLLRPEADQRCRVVVLEDLHWADASCHEVIRFLTRVSEHDRLLLIGTYRSEALDQHHRLTQLVAHLARERRVDEIQLLPLSRDDLARMLESTLAFRVPASVVEILHDHTGGNPFFVEEIIGAMVERGRLDALVEDARHGRGAARVIVPLSLRASILSRAAEIDATAAAVLTAAAVIGRRFDFDLLQHCTRLDEPTLVRALEALIARQLVVEETGGPDDRYAFRHALTREAIYGDLFGRERQMRHRAILEALEALHAADPEAVIDQLAYHSLHARALEKAAVYARLAGARAMHLSAHREAVAHFEAALGLLGADDLRARAELLFALGEAAFPLGDTELCLRYWQEARRAFEQLGDVQSVGAIRRRLGRIAWERGEMAEAFAHAQAAVEILESGPPGHERAMAYGALAQLLMTGDRPHEAIAWGERALAVAGEIGDPAVTAHAMNTIAAARAELGEWRRGLAELERSLAVAQEHRLAFDTFRAYNNLADLLTDAGMFRRAVEVAREAIPFADRLGWRGKKSMVELNLGRAEMALGRWDLALELFDRAILAGELGFPAVRLYAIPHRAELLLRRGHPDGARDLLEATMPDLERQGQLQSLNQALPTLARALLALGHPDRAAAVVERGIATAREVGPQLRAALLLGDGIAICLAIGRRDQVPELLAGLTTLAEQAAAPLALARLADVRGLVAAEAGRHDDAAGSFQDAFARWQAMECPYEAARAQLRWADSRLRLAGSSAQQEATMALSEAREAFARLGAPLDLADVDAALKRHHIPARTRRVVSGAGALTPREREVLALLVRGLSNRAIAAELFISQKTTEVHVGSILGKLGCATRAQAAALAVAQGLATLDQ